MTIGTGTTSSSGRHDGENANVAYFCHALYLVLAPVYYVVVLGELSMFRPSDNTSTKSSSSSSKISSSSKNNNSNNNNNNKIKDIMLLLPLECALRQAVGTAIAAIYYMGIVTPASIVAGLNVNFLLVGGGGDDGENFRLRYMLEWFVYGCVIRFLLGVLEFGIRRVVAWVNDNNNNNNINKNDDDDGTSNNDKRQ